MSKHTASVSITFISPKGFDPSSTAQQMVQDLIDSGYEATLDDVSDNNPLAKYSWAHFRISSLEAGHGDDFKALFVLRHEPDHMYCIESVDIQLIKDNVSDVVPYIINVGGVGGELLMKCDVSWDGEENIEQMCRAWLSLWARTNIGKCEDSVHGMFLIIKQIVSEGIYLKETTP
jgi:hypothetical protein